MLRPSTAAARTANDDGERGKGREGGGTRGEIE